MPPNATLDYTPQLTDHPADPAVYDSEDDLNQWLHFRDEEVTAGQLASDFLGHPEKYHEGLASHIGRFLLREGQVQTVLENLDRFKGLSQTEILITAMNQGGNSYYVEDLLMQMKTLDKADAAKLIADENMWYWYGSRIISMSDDPTDTVYQAVASHGQTGPVPHGLGVDYPGIIGRLINEGRQEDIHYILPALDPDTLDQALAKDLLERGYGREVSVNLEVFKQPDLELAWKLIEEGRAEGLVDHLRKFTPQQARVIARRIVSLDSQLAFNKIDSLSTYLDEKYLNKLAEPMANDPQKAVAFTEKFFYNRTMTENHKALGNKLLKVAISHVPAARALLSYGGTGRVNEYWWAFQTAYDTVNEAKASAEDPLTYRGQTVKKSLALAAVFNGGDTAKAEALFPELRAEDLAALKAEVDEAVDSCLDYFNRDVSKSHAISQLDKTALLKPEELSFYLKPYRESVNSLIARYLVQSEFTKHLDVRDIHEIANDLRDTLSMSLGWCLNVYKREIPLYDALYKEFDEYRSDGRNPMEVYLGRDGIDAWVGRRAQDVARRRQMGPEQRREAKATGEKIKVNSQYLVYPTVFKELEVNKKRRYLKDQGIDPNSDPIFYDTGYVGSVPEDIMRVMGFSQDEIEKRIKLLEARTPSRQARAGRGSDGTVSFIEDGPKLEESARLIAKNRRTGQFDYYAAPSQAHEQFRFNMVREVIVRHFWTLERQEAQQVIAEIEQIEDLTTLKRLLNRLKLKNSQPAEAPANS